MEKRRKDDEKSKSSLPAPTAAGSAGYSPASKPLAGGSLELSYQELQRQLSEKPHNHDLRQRFQSVCEELLLKDIRSAANLSVDEKLWWNCFYKPINEFRRRLSSPGRPSSSSSPNRNDPALYKQFLSNSIAFYRQLLLKLQQAHNLPLDKSLEPPASDEKEILAQVLCYHSYHRSLVCLGDLERYRQGLPGLELPEKREALAKAGGYYRQAIALFPANGNPYNQLAVLANQAEDELSEIYYYFRSLKSKLQFANIRNNMNALFEKNRLKIAALSSRFEPLRPNKGKKGPHDRQKLQKRLPESTSEQLKHFFTGFVRLHGIIFTRTSSEMFDAIKSRVLRDLDGLMRKEVLLAKEILRLLFVNALAVEHHLAWPRPDYTPTQQEVSDHAVLQEFLIRFVVEFFSKVLKGFRISRHAASPSPPPPKHGDSSSELSSDENGTPSEGDKRQLLGSEVSEPSWPGDNSSNTLGALSLFVEWLKSSPQVLNPTWTSDKRVWTNMWKSFAKLLNHVKSMMPTDAPQQESLMLPLVEDAELRGISTLMKAIGNPQFKLTKSLDVVVQQDEEAMFRIRASRIYSFGLYVSQASGMEPKLYFSEEEKKFSVRPFKVAVAHCPPVPPTAPSFPGYLPSEESILEPTDNLLEEKDISSYADLAANVDALTKEDDEDLEFGGTLNVTMELDGSKLQSEGTGVQQPHSNGSEDEKILLAPGTSLKKHIEIWKEPGPEASRAPPRAAIGSERDHHSARHTTSFEVWQTNSRETTADNSLFSFMPSPWPAASTSFSPTGSFFFNNRDSLVLAKDELLSGTFQQPQSDGSSFENRSLFGFESQFSSPFFGSTSSIWQPSSTRSFSKP